LQVGRCYLRASTAVVDVLNELSGDRGRQVANLVVFELEEATVRNELE
jgi:hypothetical protein